MLSLLVTVVWGGVGILLVLNLVRKRVLNSAEYGLQHNSTPSPPVITQCIYYTVRLLWEGERGEVRKKVEGQQFTRRVENASMTDTCCGSGMISGFRILDPTFFHPGSRIRIRIKEFKYF
jgi:hypothetical protein